MFSTTTKTHQTAMIWLVRCLIYFFYRPAPVLFGLCSVAVHTPPLGHSNPTCAARVHYLPRSHKPQPPARCAALVCVMVGRTRECRAVPWGRTGWKAAPHSRRRSAVGSAHATGASPGCRIRQSTGTQTLVHTCTHQAWREPATKSNSIFFAWRKCGILVTADVLVEITARRTQAAAPQRESSRAGGSISKNNLTVTGRV